MEEMKVSPVMIAILAFLVTWMTVLVAPIYTPPGLEPSDSNIAQRGWPVAFMSYYSTSQAIPFVGWLLEPFSFVFTSNFSLVGFIIDWALWFSILYFIFSFLGRPKEQ